MLDIIKDMMLNISLLILLAYCVTKIPLVKRFIVQDERLLHSKLAMGVIFGLAGVISTYTGVHVQGAIANTRVIGVIAGGMLCGPFVGILAGLLAGVHRLATDIGGFTAVACACSTLMEGVIGGLCHKHLKEQQEKWFLAGIITILAEVLQMAVILAIARPFSDAWALVKLIAVPMIVCNSIGAAAFIGIFDSVFIEQDREAGHRVRLVMDIADGCLPYLRHGLHDKTALNAALAVILAKARPLGVMITDTTSILCCGGSVLEKSFILSRNQLPRVVMQTLSSHRVEMQEDTSPDDPLFPLFYKKCNAVCAPLTMHEEVIGTLVLLVRKHKLSWDVECEFAGGLARLFSTQLELSQVEYQKKLRQKAELAALQSQINPHFLFNALSTITHFCRQKPDRARELLIVLSHYFRNTLKTGRVMIPLEDELEHVNAYLELEKARFEERLQLEISQEQNTCCEVPSFILQPIVENAVKHGAMGKSGIGIVKIRVTDIAEGVRIVVSDNGAGIPPEIIQGLYEGNLDSGSVGLANVHKRLKSIYGENNGLLIDTGNTGTSITLSIPSPTSVCVP